VEAAELFQTRHQAQDLPEAVGQLNLEEHQLEEEVVMNLVVHQWEVVANHLAFYLVVLHPVDSHLEVQRACHCA